MPANAVSFMIQTTAPATGSKDNLFWIDNTNPLLPVMKYWNGSAWTPISTATAIALKKTNDQIINGTAFQDVTGLTFPVLANTDYAFDFYVVFRVANVATGNRFSLNGPAGSTVDFFMTHQTVVNSSPLASWLQGHWIAYDSSVVTTNSPVANADMCCRITGRVKVGATAGTIAVRAASELANNDLVIQKGSWGLYF